MALDDQNALPKPFANNSILLKFDNNARKVMEKKLLLLENQKIKELILLDGYIKSQRRTEKQLSELKMEQNDFNNKNLKKNVTKECKFNHYF